MMTSKIKNQLEFSCFNLLIKSATQPYWKNTFLAFILVSNIVLWSGNHVIAQINFSPVQVNPFQLFDIGSRAAPAFADLDNDGDFDLLAGIELGDFFYFENIGTNTAPIFLTPTTNPFSLTNIGQHASLTFVDLDNDNDKDIMVGDKFGDFHYFENIGTASVPNFGPVQINPFSLATTDPDPFPSFADLDGDGDLDLLHGGLNGDLFYRENTGTTTAPNFALAQTNPFSLTNAGFDSAPVFADLDLDGDYDVLVAERFGTFLYFENIGTTTAPNFALAQTNPFSLTTVFAVPIPTFVDLNNSGSLDLMVGDEFGNFNYFENTSIITGIQQTKENAIRIYPNAANTHVTIATDLSFADTQITISNLAGKQIYSNSKLTAAQHTLDVSSWASGTYLVQIISTRNVQTLRLIKL